MGTMLQFTCGTSRFHPIFVCFLENNTLLQGNEKVSFVTGSSSDLRAITFYRIERLFSLNVTFLQDTNHRISLLRCS